MAYWLSRDAHTARLLRQEKCKRGLTHSGNGLLPLLTAPFPCCVVCCQCHHHTSLRPHQQPQCSFSSHIITIASILFHVCISSSHIKIAIISFLIPLVSFPQCSHHHNSQFTTTQYSSQPQCQRSHHHYCCYFVSISLDVTGLYVVHHISQLLSLYFLFHWRLYRSAHITITHHNLLFITTMVPHRSSRYHYCCYFASLTLCHWFIFGSGPHHMYISFRSSSHITVAIM